ncbi:MAG: pyridoxal phosphate-dependent aminotransferase [Pikeienuella sp.]
MITPRPHVADLAAYALADLSVAPGVRLISLAQNESCVAPSPRAIEAAARAMADGALYPDPDWTGLRAAIAEVHGIDTAGILCGAGSMELISALIRTYAGPGDEVVSTAYAYALFRTAALASGASYKAADEDDLTVSVDNLLTNVGPKTRIVCVANPGNPTGSCLSRSELVRLRDGLPENVLLLIDEAYGEFANTEACFGLVDRGDTIVMRTFSKAYGLAGLRVGWGLFPPEVAGEVRKLMNPNNIAGPAQVAATAAMRDQPYMLAAVAEVSSRRDRFATTLREIGLDAQPSAANFTLIRFANATEAQSADMALRAKGILMRGMGGYGLPHCLRATIAGEDDMALATQVLTNWKEAHHEQ